MIGLDTNILVRYLAQDDELQSPVATTLMNTLSSEAPGFVSLVTLVELVWVMQSCYSTTKLELVSILNLLLKTQELRLENTETVIKSVALFSASNADFSDCLIERTAHQAGCDYTATFDRNAAKTAGMKFIC